MAASGYWGRIARTRLSRRRALTSAAMFGGGAMALGLTGCGGDDGRAGSATRNRGILSEIKDTSAQATQGGTLNTTGRDMASLDPITSPTAVTRNEVGGFAYNKLFRAKVGTFEAPSDGTIEGDLAESWEFADDGKRLIVKLRRNAGTDPRPPTNGRVINAEDVKLAWDLYAERGPSRADLVNSVNPNAPVIRLSMPDTSPLSQCFS
jgi:ABC-type transport system substrate-binding protein